MVYFALDSSVVVKTFLGLETKTESWAFRSRDQDRDLGHQVSRPRPSPGQNELECTRVSRPYGLEITTLAASILDIGDRALA